MASRKARPLHDLTFEDALRLVFPELLPDERMSLGRLPKRWRPWKRPAYDKLAHLDAATRRLIEARSATFSDLDDAIDKLIDGRRDRLKGDGEPCPYYSTRFRIAHAAYQGALSAAKEQDRTTQSRRLAKHTAFMAKQAEELRFYFFDEENPKRFLHIETAPMDDYGIAAPDDAAINAALQASSEALKRIQVGIEALEKLAAACAAEQKRLPSVQKNQHPWEEGFIQSLGRVYREWTGRDPAIGASGPFADFANAAYQAVGGDKLSDKSMTNAIRRIKGTQDGTIQARPARDQFDVYADIRKPTTAEMEDLRAAEKKRQGTKAEQWRDEIRALVEHLASEEANEQKSALALLALEYRRADGFIRKDDKAFIESLLPDEMVARLRGAKE